MKKKKPVKASHKFYQIIERFDWFNSRAKIYYSDSSLESTRYQLKRYREEPRQCYSCDPSEPVIRKVTYERFSDSA